MKNYKTAAVCRERDAMLCYNEGMRDMTDNQMLGDVI